MRLKGCAQKKNICAPATPQLLLSFSHEPSCLLIFCNMTPADQLVNGKQISQLFSWPGAVVQLM